MKILLDENLDWRLSRSLQGHDVESVARNGWAGINNGELLRRANAAFDALITMDRGIYHQQNLSGLKLIVVALRAKTNRLADTATLASSLLQALTTAKPGDYLVVGV